MATGGACGGAEDRAPDPRDALRVLGRCAANCWNERVTLACAEARGTALGGPWRARDPARLHQVGDLSCPGVKGLDPWDKHTYLSVNGSNGSSVASVEGERWLTPGPSA